MPEKSDTHRVSREHFSVVKLGESDDSEYWRSRTVEERLEYMEYLRRVNYGDEAAERLQRVLEVVERP